MNLIYLNFIMSINIYIDVGMEYIVVQYGISL